MPRRTDIVLRPEQLRSLAIAREIGGLRITEDDRDFIDYVLRRKAVTRGGVSEYKLIELAEWLTRELCRSWPERTSP